MTTNKALLALAMGLALAACSNQKQAENSAADAANSATEAQQAADNAAASGDQAAAASAQQSADAAAQAANAASTSADAAANAGSMSNADQAADAVQEAFFSAYRNLPSFRGGSVRSWLSRIAINAAMDQQRLRKRRPSQPYPELEDEAWQPPAGPDADPERTALGIERGRALHAALASITPDQRHAIVMFDVEGFDYQEIADLTGVSLGTVKSRIHRGRLALRECLADSMSLFRGDAE